MQQVHPPPLPVVREVSKGMMLPRCARTVMEVSSNSDS